jgi:hypothetical protein
VIGWIVGGALALLIVWVFVLTRRAGPAHLSDAQLERANVLHRWTADGPRPSWEGVGSATTVDGLRIRFDSDDDPAAEATLVVPGGRKGGLGVAQRIPVTLGADFQTYHAHTAGHVFRLSMRGTGPVVGKEVIIMMKPGAGGRPYGGRIENDDDTDAAVGGWIEIEWAEILQVGRAT